MYGIVNFIFQYRAVRYFSPFQNKDLVFYTANISWITYMESLLSKIENTMQVNIKQIIIHINEIKAGKVIFFQVLPSLRPNVTYLSHRDHVTCTHGLSTLQHSLYAAFMFAKYYKSITIFEEIYFVVTMFLKTL